MRKKNSRRHMSLSATSNIRSLICSQCYTAWAWRARVRSRSSLTMAGTVPLQTNRMIKMWIGKAKVTLVARCSKMTWHLLCTMILAVTLITKNTNPGETWAAQDPWLVRKVCRISSFKLLLSTATKRTVRSTQSTLQCRCVDTNRDSHR